MCVHVPRDARKCRKPRRNEAIARAINFNWEQHVDSLHNLPSRGGGNPRFFPPPSTFPRISPPFLCSSLFSALAHKRSSSPSSLFSLLCMRIVGIDSLWGRTIFFLSRKEVSYSVKFILRMCNNNCQFLFNFLTPLRLNLIKVNKNLYSFESCIRYFLRGNCSGSNSFVTGLRLSPTGWDSRDVQDGRWITSSLVDRWHVDTITLCLLECYSMPRNPTGA